MIAKKINIIFIIFILCNNSFATEYKENDICRIEDEYYLAGKIVLIENELYCEYEAIQPKEDDYVDEENNIRDWSQFRFQLKCEGC